jgi:hypothetical protein
MPKRQHAGVIMWMNEVLVLAGEHQTHMGADFLE